MYNHVYKLEQHIYHLLIAIVHQYKWLESEDLIGDIPLEWNWLVGEYKHNEDVKNVHYTEGGPWFKEYKDCDYSQDWFYNYKEAMLIG